MLLSFTCSTCWILLLLNDRVPSTVSLHIQLEKIEKRYPEIVYSSNSEVYDQPKSSSYTMEVFEYNKESLQDPSLYFKILKQQ